MTAGVDAPRRARISARTLRTDRWWLPPLVTNIGFAAFLIYATFRSFYGKDYWVDEYHYLTPFTSPCVSESCVPGSSHFGTWLPELPSWIPLGFLVLPFLLGFRLHRYFFYAAILVSLVNTYDAVVAFHSPSGFGFGLGNVVLTVNVVLLWAYTLSCHSCRHIAGGRLRHFSNHPVRYRAWTFISKLNVRHMQLAWTTLGTLVLTDLYVWLVASGTISDLRFIG